jgi:outer membrane protein TolC
MIRSRNARCRIALVLAGPLCLAVAWGSLRPLAAAEPLELSVSDAVLLALEHNRELVVERLEPEITRTEESEAYEPFDPRLELDEIGIEREEGEKLRGLGISERYETDSAVGRVAIESLLPTGTGIALEAGTEISDEASTRQLVRSRVGLTVSQALLQGFGPGANLARLREARAGTEISTEELRGFSHSLVALVEQAYWEHAFRLREVEILVEAVELAQTLVSETEERIRAGSLGRVESAAAESEVVLRRQALTRARGDLERARLALLRLVNPGGADPWDHEVRPRDPLLPTEEAPDTAEEHLAVAERLRPELAAARALVERGEYQLVRTKNGLLPRMDLFVTLGRSGYASSFQDSWSAIDDDFDDLRAGLSLELPLGRHVAKAEHRRATLEHEQAEGALDNLRQLVALDVRTALVGVAEARELATLAARTRQLDEAKLHAEWEKHRLGRSSAFQVARALRDLARSRVDEVEALADARIALVELYRLDGSLLDRRGITTPAPPTPPPSTN